LLFVEGNLQVSLFCLDKFKVQCSKFKVGGSGAELKVISYELIVTKEMMKNGRSSF
jgi:hypothetical protein